MIKKIFFDSRLEKPKISFPSKIGGGLIGSFKGAVLVFIILFCIHLSMGIFIRQSTAVSKQIEDSFFYSYLIDNNTFLNIKATRNIYFAAKLLKEKRAILLENDEIIRKLKENPSLEAIANDEGLKESIQNKDYKKILANPNFRKLLNDKNLFEQIRDIDFEGIYNKGGSK